MAVIRPFRATTWKAVHRGSHGSRFPAFRRRPQVRHLLSDHSPLCQLVRPCRLAGVAVPGGKGPAAAPPPTPWLPPWWVGFVAKECLYNLIYPAVLVLGWLFWQFTDVLLTWPYWASGAIALVFVTGSGWALALVKRNNAWPYGIFKVLIGCGLSVWALTDGRPEQGKPPVIALWISLLLAVDFVVDGFEQYWSKPDEKPAPQTAKSNP